ncbi:hypothetical protein LBMAG35_07300 [Chlorobiota bacterium]|nr:hypothetical protein LBMAG35_07300 [Chlorobiota bacterium]
MMNQQNNSNNDSQSGKDMSEDPTITKLKNEILQLQQTLEIRMEENKYLRMQLNRLDRNRKIGDLPFIQNLRPETRERGSTYIFGLKETDFIPKLQLRKQLLRRHPMLSSNDIDFSIMLSIGLTNKEIMILSGKSHSTIENNASILKSKLFGEHSQRDLRSYLYSLEIDAITDSSREFSIDKIMRSHDIVLSHTECKVCGMIVLRMRNKDICDTLMISPRTLESHKYRIKKKCKLTRCESLMSRLHELISPYL